jgi:hypothetical protein
MSKRSTTLLALAVTLLAAAGVASACPYSRSAMTLAPRPYLPVDHATITVENADSRFDTVEKRGPALWSAEDVVDLEVVEHAGGHVVLKATRTLETGRVYQLVFTRTGTGFGLQNAQLVGAAFRAVDSSGPSPCASGCPSSACGATSLLGRLATFGFMPFALAYGLTTIIIIRRRRRALASL